MLYKKVGDEYVVYHTPDTEQGPAPVRGGADDLVTVALPRATWDRVWCLMYQWLTDCIEEGLPADSVERLGQALDSIDEATK